MPGHRGRSMTTPRWCPSADSAGGHSPLSRRPVPGPYREGTCRTVPVPCAPCRGVVSLPRVAAVLTMLGRLPAVGHLTHGNRATGQPVTVPSVPLCCPVIPCAVARMLPAQPIGADRVQCCPQWPITGRCLVGSWSPVGWTRTTRKLAVGCVRGATTGPPQPIRLPVVVGSSRPASPQGVTPPPTGSARSSARPGCVPTGFAGPVSAPAERAALRDRGDARGRG